MPLSELDIARVQSWCAARVPEHARDQVLVECQVSGSPTVEGGPALVVRCGSSGRCPLEGAAWEADSRSLMLSASTGHA
jgi:hypothetical protein